MSLAALYAHDKPVISFELFPPKSEAGMQQLFVQVAELVACRPAYMTCTYGAGGSTRDRTLQVLQRLHEVYPELPLATHLTCVGATVEYLCDYLRRAREAGVGHVVALRGDAPQDQPDFVPVPGGLRHARDLVVLIRENYPEMGIAVGGYPETHPEAVSPEADINFLKAKVDAGADIVTTQLFYDNEDFFRWRDRCEAAGISVPIVPGVLPVTNLAQVRRITGLCGAKLHPTLLSRLETQVDEEGQFMVGLYYATRQVEELLEQGVPGVHFYVLNKSRAAAFICQALALATPAGLRSPLAPAS